MLGVPWSSKIGVHDVPAFVVFHTPPYADATYQTLLSRGSTARSTMRPELTAGPIERNERPEYVSLSGFTVDFASAFPPGFSFAFAAGFSAGLADAFAAGFSAGLEDCAAARGASSASEVTMDRACVGRRRIMGSRSCEEVGVRGAPTP